MEPMGGQSTMGRGRWDLKHGALALVWALMRRRVALMWDRRRIVGRGEFEVARGRKRAG